MAKMHRLGILLSGRGSNFMAIADNVAAGRIPAEIAVVISNRADAPGLEEARRRGLDARFLPSKGLEREQYDRQVVAVLDDDTPDTLAARILKEEHRIYSEAINLVLSGRWKLAGRRVLRTA